MGIAVRRDVLSGAVGRLGKNFPMSVCPYSVTLSRSAPCREATSAKCLDDTLLGPK
jgi:hypothetical protein